MKFKIKHFKILNKVVLVLSLVCLVSAMISSFYPIPQITKKMYQSPEGMEAIISIFTAEISRLRAINILELGFVFFLLVAILIDFQLKMIKFEERLDKEGSL